MSLRILHVTPYFVDAWAYGGIPRIATTLVRELGRRGHHVTVCTTDAADAHQRAGHGPSGTAGSDARCGGAEVRTFPNISNALAYHNQLFLPRGLGAYLRTRAGDFDVAHLHACRNLPVSLAARHLRRAGVPYVMAPNGTAPRIERRLVAKWAYDQVLGAADLPGAAAVIAVTEAERRQLEGLGIDPARIRVVPNPVDLDEHRQPVARGRFRDAHGLGAGPLVLFLGKLTPRKRVDVLIRAMAHGVRRDARLVIAGNDMGAAPELMRQARALHLADRIAFVGLLRGTDRLEALADADVVVYPSADEIFGLVPLEALLVGTPVIVSDDSGCGEVIGEVGGGLVMPLGDHASLASGITEILGNPGGWRAQARAAAAHVGERFGGAVVAGHLDALYHDLVAAN
jgi:glycosyltransferase involved in cell wall biosynthesis